MVHVILNIGLNVHEKMLDITICFYLAKETGCFFYIDADH